MKIGIDFDNTIACYDRAFAFAARDMGLLAACDGLDKRAVRERVRSEAGERVWMRLQGRVYGFYIEQATLFDGFPDFVRAARAAGCSLCIISHKSHRGHFDPDEIDLIDAARGWMHQRGFFDVDGLGFTDAEVGFHASRADKLQAIADAACDVFVDDLLEVLCDAAFPAGCRRVLFAPSGVGADGLLTVHNWASLTRAVLAC